MGEGFDPELNTKFTWREVGRAELPKRSPSERVSDFLEVYSDLDEATAQAQAARCIQCPQPTCVTACPMGNRIPEWLGLTAEGHFLEAAELVVSTSSMPEVFCRLCAQERQCEAHCVLGGPSEAVPIGAIERFLQEYAFRSGIVDGTPVVPNGFKVAVVGSGPSGLICANDLARQGYAVTVFESQSVPGGLLVQGIPAFKLERAIVDRRVDLLKRRGVEFRLGVRLGTDVRLEGLRRDFDAIFLGIGARQARSLQVSGADLKGVVQGVVYMVAHNSGLRLEGPWIDVAGKRVVVLGGGDTAMDCVRTAIRCGAAEVLCGYRRDLASLPAMRRHYTSAVEEGAKFLFQAMPVEVQGGADGVTGVRFQRTELVEDAGSGQRVARGLPGTETVVPADWVMVAYGFERVPCPPGCDLHEVATDAEGYVVVDQNEMTNIPGVFAGGDLVHGPGQLVQTVREARKGARGIHTWLSARREA